MKKNLKSSYKVYKNSVERPIDVKNYLLIVGDFLQFLIQKVLEGHEVTLPNRLGKLSIIGREQKITIEKNGKIKGLAPDWVKTKELWEKNPEARKNKKLVYHTNNKTGGITYRYFWAKKNVIILNKNLYSLRLTRTNKRAASSLINSGKEYETKIFAT